LAIFKSPLHHDTIALDFFALTGWDVVDEVAYVFRSIFQSVLTSPVELTLAIAALIASTVRPSMDSLSILQIVSVLALVF